MHNLVYFVNLYVFRAYLGPSSGGTTVCIQQLVLILILFFFHWRYSPLWALTCRTIPLHFSLSITNPLHLLTPSTWRSLSTSSLHPFLGLPLRLVPSSSWVKIFSGILSSSILSRWPNQLILCPFIHFTIFSPLFNSSSSQFVVLFHSSSSYLGPYILLNIFLSKISRTFFPTSSSSMFPLHTLLSVLLVSYIVEQQLVLIIAFRWLSVVQSNEKNTQSSKKNNKYQMLYTYGCTSWWWAQTRPKPPVGQGLLIVEASPSHSDISHSVGLLWTSDEPDVETSSWQHTTITRDRYPRPSGIRTHNPSKRAAADPCIIRRGHRDHRNNSASIVIGYQCSMAAWILLQACRINYSFTRNPAFRCGVIMGSMIKFRW